jgi:hypothetical protein
VYRLREKVLVGPPQEARITHFCETTAIITLAGQLTVWENVRLHLLADDSREVAGKMYGKVVAVAPGATFCLQATIRFTSISPEVFLVIRNLPGENQKTGHKQ